MSKIMQTYQLVKIQCPPTNPLLMFKTIIGRLDQNFIAMNLATVDKEFGVLNRSVIYRGLIDDSHICFVTERNSRKYENLKENPKLGLTMLFSIQNYAEKEEFTETWQIRLIDAEAVELDDGVIERLWQEEPLFAKIRSHICECGRPNDHKELERKCNEMYERYQKECKEPEQTKSYTAFKIIPKRWDFYKGEPNKIADRVQYKRLTGETDEWEICHVDA